MKKRDLEKQMSEYGWHLHRHGGKHDYWTNGEIFESVPRHKEVNEMLAKKILKTAKNNPPKQ
ncbi:MAG: type II toxin-antitoxin system HicA family toxin [Chlamydiae bacterium]|nr:type II toxin-antitoxin system HicA family toxin [Chlamydiota bacterium]